MTMRQARKERTRWMQSTGTHVRLRYWIRAAAKNGQTFTGKAARIAHPGMVIAGRVR